MKFCFRNFHGHLFWPNLLETTISLQRRNLRSRWFSFYQGGIWTTFPWRVSNRGHEITQPPPLKRGIKQQKCLVIKSGVWISPEKIQFGSVWFSLVSNQKVTNSLPQPTQQKPNPPFGERAQSSHQLHLPSSGRRRPCLVETLAARSCRPPSIHPSWRSNNRRNRRNANVSLAGSWGGMGVGWQKKAWGWGGWRFFFCWGGGRMVMLFWWYRWNFGQGNWRWDLSKGKLHGLNSGLVPRFQRHQDVEGSTMLMNWSVFLPVKWLVHQILIWVSKIGKALEKTSGFL